MEYKGYSISQVEAVILLDILETQKEILQELREFKHIETEPIVEAYKTDTEVKPEVTITDKPVQKKPAKKKSTAKSKSKKS